MNFKQHQLFTCQPSKHNQQATLNCSVAFSLANTPTIQLTKIPPSISSIFQSQANTTLSANKNNSKKNSVIFPEFPADISLVLVQRKKLNLYYSNATCSVADPSLLLIIEISHFQFLIQFIDVHPCLFEELNLIEVTKLF